MEWSSWASCMYRLMLFLKPGILLVTIFSNILSSPFSLTFHARWGLTQSSKTLIIFFNVYFPSVPQSG